MKAFQPEQRIAYQEATYLVATVVEYVALPVGMKSLSRVGVLIQMSSIEIEKSVGVARKMRRHPIEDNAYTFLVEAIDQVHEILRSTKPTCWRVVTSDLVSP